MFKLSTQLWVSEDYHLPLHKDLIQPVKNYRTGIKGTGGLWTSTWLGEELGSEWIQFCKQTNLYSYLNGKWRGCLLEPKDDLKIYIIDSLKDMHVLFDKYGYNLFEDFPDLEKEGIDFEKMSQDYDAVHLTSYGQKVTRHGGGFFGDPYYGEELEENWKQKRLRNLYGWDVCEALA